jgi:uncharacterized membrane protein
MDGAACYRNMNMRGSTPNQATSAKAAARQEQMQTNGNKPRVMDAAEGSIAVKAPVAAIYKRWLEFEEYPKFITAIKRVRKLDSNHFSALLSFNGKRHEALLEIMLRVPERKLAWRTIANDGAPHHFAAGVVYFASHPNQNTCITLRLTSSFGGAVSHRVDQYLQNFKRLVEAG